jgi:hypothetical protein
MDSQVTTPYVLEFVNGPLDGKLLTLLVRDGVDPFDVTLMDETPQGPVFYPVDTRRDICGRPGLLAHFAPDFVPPKGGDHQCGTPEERASETPDT